MIDQNYFYAYFLIHHKFEKNFPQLPEKQSLFISKTKKLPKTELKKILLASILKKEKLLIQKIKNKEFKKKYSSINMLDLLIGDYYYYLNQDYLKAINFYTKGLNGKRFIGYRETICILNIGISYQHLNNLSKSKKYLKKSRKLMKKKKNLYSNDLILNEKYLKQLYPSAKNIKPTLSKTKREQIIQTAVHLLGSRWTYSNLYKGKHFHFDCSGTIRKIYWSQNIDLLNGVKKLNIKNKNGVYLIYKLLQKKKKIYKSNTPKPGDIIFFDNTFDRNKDGKWNDKLVHMGIVESVDKDKTISYIHHTSKGIKRFKMNLLKPKTYKDPKTGKIYNSFLRRKKTTDPKGANYLSAYYFAGFGRILESN